MKLIGTTLYPFCLFLFLGLSSLPNIAFSQDIYLTCPNSGKGTPSIELTLTALGGFELPKDQTMFLSLQFDHAKVERGDSQNRVKLSCIYNTFTEKRTEKKTVTLVAYTPSGTTNCSTTSNIKDGKLNQIVCKSQ